MTNSTAARSSYLMRAGLVRNVRSGEHLTTFVVSGVATVLVTRLILSLSGYPQIGGKGLHIAHVLPGGLLMLIAISLLLGYVGPVVRPAAATVGGIGFGLFIDEVGKFVTSDNNYFYKPTAAIVYVVFVLIILGFRFLTTRRPIDPREELANVIDHAVEGVAGGCRGVAERRRQSCCARCLCRCRGGRRPGTCWPRARPTRSSWLLRSMRGGRRCSAGSSDSPRTRRRRGSLSPYWRCRWLVRCSSRSLSAMG